MTSDIVEIIIFGTCLSLWNFKLGMKVALKHRVYWLWACLIAPRDIIAGYKQVAAREGVPPELLSCAHHSLFYIIGMDYLVCPMVFWLFTFFMR